MWLLSLVVLWFNVDYIELFISSLLTVISFLVWPHLLSLSSCVIKRGMGGWGGRDGGMEGTTHDSAEGGLVTVHTPPPDAHVKQRKWNANSLSHTQTDTDRHEARKCADAWTYEVRGSSGDLLPAWCRCSLLPWQRSACLIWRGS